MSDKRKIKIKIDSKGQYTIEAMEGFSGETCIEKTKNVELLLGGEKVASGKKGEYYDNDASSALFLNI